MVEWAFDARDAQAARRTRLDFVAYLQRECGDVDVSSAELVLGELIGNVARYAPGPAHVVVDVTGSLVSIFVTDRGQGFTPAPRCTPDVLAERGRGLLIVEALATAFNVECNDGCRVHATVPVAAPANATLL
jgi:anti-sigma regulatory factor (Ser/Thr protein kinase)